MESSQIWVIQRKGNKNNLLWILKSKYNATRLLGCVSKVMTLYTAILNTKICCFWFFWDFLKIKKINTPIYNLCQLPLA